MPKKLRVGDLVDWRSLDEEGRWATARALLGRSVRLTCNAGDGSPSINEGVVDAIVLEEAVAPPRLAFRFEWSHPYQDWDEAYLWDCTWTIEILPDVWAERMRARRAKGS